MEHARRKQKKTYNVPGHAHYLTFSCHKQLPLLNRDRTRQWFIESLDRARRKHAMSLWAYVIMPEHVHIVVHPRQSTYRIEKFLFSCKRPVSWRAKQWLAGHGETEWLERLTVLRGDKPTFRFWLPGGGFDRNVIEPAGVRAAIEYVHGNPVRRGLVENAEDWYWSSAGFWAGHANVPLAMDPLDI